MGLDAADKARVGLQRWTGVRKDECWHRWLLTTCALGGWFFCAQLARSRHRYSLVRRPICILSQSPPTLPAVLDFQYVFGISQVDKPLNPVSRKVQILDLSRPTPRFIRWPHDRTTPSLWHTPICNHTPSTLFDLPMALPILTKSSHPVVPCCISPATIPERARVRSELVESVLAWTFPPRLLRF